MPRLQPSQNRPTVERNYCFQAVEGLAKESELSLMEHEARLVFVGILKNSAEEYDVVPGLDASPGLALEIGHAVFKARPFLPLQPRICETALWSAREMHCQVKL